MAGPDAGQGPEKGSGAGAVAAGPSRRLSMAEFGVLVGAAVVFAAGVAGVISVVMRQEEPEPQGHEAVLASPPAAATPAASAAAVTPPAAAPVPPVVVTAGPSPVVPAPKTPAPESAPPEPAVEALPVIVPSGPEPPAPPGAEVGGAATSDPPPASLTSPLPKRKPAVPKAAAATVNPQAVKLSPEQCNARFSQVWRDANAELRRLIARDGDTRAGQCRIYPQAKAILTRIARQHRDCLRLDAMHNAKLMLDQAMRDIDGRARRNCG